MLSRTVKIQKTGHIMTLYSYKEYVYEVLGHFSMKKKESSLNSHWWNPGPNTWDCWLAESETSPWTSAKLFRWTWYTAHLTFHRSTSIHNYTEVTFSCMLHIQKLGCLENIELTMEFPEFVFGNNCTDCIFFLLVWTEPLTDSQ